MTFSLVVKLTYLLWTTACGGRFTYDPHSHLNPKIHAIGNHGYRGALHAKATPALWKIVDKCTRGGAIVDQAALQIRAHRPPISNSELSCVVDLGTGTGRFADALVRNGVCDTVVAIDSSDEMLAVARQETQYATSITFINHNVMTDPLPQASLITMSFLLHEMPAGNMYQLLRDAALSLDDGGMLAIVDADVEGNTKLPAWYIDRCEPYFPEYQTEFNRYINNKHYERYGLVMLEHVRVVPGAACIWLFRLQTDPRPKRSRLYV